MKLQLDGFYRYSVLPNRQGTLTGEIEVDGDCSFKGIVTDGGSSRPRQSIRGYFDRNMDGDEMLFLKYPLDENLANLLYALQKEPGGDLQGRYVGSWAALPYKISVNERGLYVVKADISISGIGESAEITLSR